MAKKINDKGLSLIELIIAVAIMVILVGVVAPTMVQYVDKAREAKVQQEASQFIRTAEVAYIEVCTKGKEPKADSVKNKTISSSPYYRGGTAYGNLTNWTVHNGVVATASNAPFAEEFFSLLGITIGREWKNGNTVIPISPKQPKITPSGSLTKECVFQLFYDKNGSMVVEYSRMGYFVRMENSIVVQSVKIKNSSERLFTSWQ